MGAAGIQNIRQTRHLCENSFLHFIRYFFKDREGSKFIVNDHHKLMVKTLNRVVSGEITRLIINIPPGYTKTEMAVINFIAWGLANNPRARFLHLSYSDKLAELNSSTTRKMVTSEDYQQLWPKKLRSDADSKKMWYTELNGGLYATAAGGQVTGFRAGRMEPNVFSGCLIIDDPIKPADAKSALKRDLINDDFNNTVKSRLALETTPIVTIMQRIHDDDLSGYLLRGGSGEKWHHLLLPVMMDHSEPYPKKYTHGIPIDTSELAEGPLWEKKQNAENIENIKQSHPYTYHSQYKQDPQPIGERIFHEEWWKYYDNTIMGSYEYLQMFADTAQKLQKHNDFSVLQLWGKRDGDIYLLDQIRGKWEAPDLERNVINFVAKWYKPKATYNKIRSLVIEDKSSGTGLIQGLASKLPVAIEPIVPYGDKLSRAMDAAPFVKVGRVFLPEKASYLIDYIDEFDKFSKDDSHNFDDQVDPTMYAIQTMIQGSMEVGTW